jgi:hypothetical protein
MLPGGRPRNRGSIFGGGRQFFVTHSVQIGSGTYTMSSELDEDLLLQEGKNLEPEAITSILA